MQQIELIICYSDNTWSTDVVNAERHDAEQDIHQAYLEKYQKDMTEGTRDIVFIGTYSVNEDAYEEEE